MKLSFAVGIPDKNSGNWGKSDLFFLIHYLVSELIKKNVF